MLEGLLLPQFYTYGSLNDRLLVAKSQISHIRQILFPYNMNMKDQGAFSLELQ